MASVTWMAMKHVSSDTSERRLPLDVNELDQRLKIDEYATPAGHLIQVHVHWTGAAMSISEGQQRFVVPRGALDAVMNRFGGPLDPEQTVHHVARIDLGGGFTLRHVRHLSGYDVVARDYLLYEQPEREIYCCLAITVAGALLHVGRAAAAAAAAVSAS